VKPSPSAQNRATLYYNCARASANIGRQLDALRHCTEALAQVPKYLSALEQRAKCQLALYNYKVGLCHGTAGTRPLQLQRGKEGGEVDQTMNTYWDPSLRRRTLD